MPRKPKRPCSFPGCPNLTDGRFCEEHEKKKTNATKDTTETLQPSVGTAERGKESVTAMLRSIQCVSSAWLLEGMLRPQRFITSCH